jgi:biotin carboxylase
MTTGALPVTFETDREPAPRRLLLVGGAGVPELEEAVARRGWRALMITFAEAGPAPAPAGAVDRVEAVDLARPLEVVRRLVALGAAREFERVVPVTEFGLLPAALATAQLGLPGLPVSAIRQTRDKLHMRRTLEQAGLGQVAYAGCRDLDAARAFLDRVDGPIVVKPVSGSGSEGISRVTTADELPAAFALAAAAAGFMGVLCEEYVEGPEVSLEAYSVGGRLVPVALTDKRTDGRFLEVGHQQPSTQPSHVFEAVAAQAARALAALGVTDGVTHSEFRLAARGPVLIETHTRMGGGSLHVLTRLTTGVDLADLMVAFGLGEAPDVRPAPQGRGAAIRFLVGRPGRIVSVEAPAAGPDDSVVAVALPAAGRVVTGRSASRERLGHVIATGPTAEAAGRIAEAFVAAVRVRYEGD